jgi:hypothetical protein
MQSCSQRCVPVCALGPRGSVGLQGPTGPTGQQGPVGPPSESRGSSLFTFAGSVTDVGVTGAPTFLPTGGLGGTTTIPIYTILPFNGTVTNVAVQIASGGLFLGDVMFSAVVSSGVPSTFSQPAISVACSNTTLAGSAEGSLAASSGNLLLVYVTGSVTGTVGYTSVTVAFDLTPP